MTTRPVILVAFLALLVPVLSCARAGDSPPNPVPPPTSGPVPPPTSGPVPLPTSGPVPPSTSVGRRLPPDYTVEPKIAMPGSQMTFICQRCGTDITTAEVYFLQYEEDPIRTSYSLDSILDTPSAELPSIIARVKIGPLPVKQEGDELRFSFTLPLVLNGADLVEDVPEGQPTHHSVFVRLRNAAGYAQGTYPHAIRIVR